jgi:hypothetical protein
VEQIEPGFYFVQMVATGKAEFDAWLARHYPTGAVIDYDDGESFADIHSAEKSAR